MASRSKGSEFLNSVMGNAAPPPQDHAEIPGDEMSKTQAMMEARKESIGSLRKQPRLAGPRKLQSDQQAESSFPLLSENERKAP